MTTPKTERVARSWRAHALKALTIAGFAATAWLLSGSAAQADPGVQADALNVAPMTETVTAPLGAPDTAKDAGLAPANSQVKAAVEPILGIVPSILSTGSEADRASSPGTTNQVVTVLAQTTRAVVSVVTETPAETGDSSLLAPLSTLTAPVTDMVRPLTQPVSRTLGLGLDRGTDDTPRLVIPANNGQAPSPLEASARAVRGGPPAAPWERTLPEYDSAARDLVAAVGDATSPVAPRPLPAPTPFGPGMGSTGSTGSLPGSQQDGGSFASSPASVTHGAPVSGVLPVTSFIGISRDSAADPMVSPD
ncbi:hypothetical protein AB0M43_30090 [Longispora sp. NPDC051575]|uniref:hypothetical protein n=1 Tax=Longispora sp. NPDC051575 TaxID=3154943 RepID=UPI00341E5734